MEIERKTIYMCKCFKKRDVVHDIRLCHSPKMIIEAEQNEQDDNEKIN